MPALVAGVARGDQVALRRVLGGRRAGRIGVMFGLAGLLLAIPLDAMAWMVGAQLLIAFAGAALARPPLSWREYQRLSLWLAGAALIVFAPLRLTPVSSLPVFALVWLGAHGLLGTYLRRGLGESL